MSLKQLSITFLFLTGFFFLNIFDLSAESGSFFVTVSTFIFAILAGFFISRQSNRYNSIKSTIAAFDGNVSAIYRSFATLGGGAQNRAGEVISEHYKKILDTGEWDWHFKNKSTTITDLNNVLEDTVGDENLPTLKSQTVNHLLASLDSLQVARKSMVSLQVERMPKAEWALVIFLGSLLLFALFLIPNKVLLLDSIMKGFFGSMIIQTIFLLRSLDTLQLFEGTLGETSAKDILAIIEGKR